MKIHHRLEPVNRKIKQNILIAAKMAQQPSGNATRRHRSSKRKLRAGYRAPSRHPRAMCHHSYMFAYWTPPISVTHVFIVEYGIARFLSAMRPPYVYSKFKHHPRLLGCLCAKFRFFGGSRC